MLQNLNLISGLPDDGMVRIRKIGPPVLFAFEGTASFTQQTGDDVAWNIVWVGPGSPATSTVPPGPMVNYIADPDLSGIALRAASTAAARIRRPWFNHPDRIQASTRDRVSRALQGVDGLVVPGVVRCRPESAADILRAIDDGGLRYPVLIRVAGQHGGKTLVRIDDPLDAAQLALSGAADKDLYITEFHDFADEDGLYRRYRLAVVGSEVFIKSVIMGAQWNLHAASRIWTEQTIAQERAIIESFDGELAPALKPIIDAIHDRLGLDYFGIDCSLRPDGSLLVFEANATMDILVDIKLQPDLWSERTARIKSALLALLGDPARWVAAQPQATEIA